jgi:hypothetical protein
MDSFASSRFSVATSGLGAWIKLELPARHTIEDLK